MSPQTYLACRFLLPEACCEPLHFLGGFHAPPAAPGGLRWFLLPRTLSQRNCNTAASQRPATSGDLELTCNKAGLLKGLTSAGFPSKATHAFQGMPLGISGCYATKATWHTHSLTLSQKWLLLGPGEESPAGKPRLVSSTGPPGVPQHWRQWSLSTEEVGPWATPSVAPKPNQTKRQLMVTLLLHIPSTREY